LPRRPASPRTESPAVPEKEAASPPPVERAKPAPRRKPAAAEPPKEPAAALVPAPRPRTKPRAVPASDVPSPAAAKRGAIARPASPSTLVKPKAPRREPGPKAVVVPAEAAPVAANAGAIPAAPVWIPALEIGGDDRANRLFTYALIASIVLHAVVLAIRFQPFDLQRMLDRGPPLEVALVNAKSPTKPSKADVLAQANLDGGGNTDANRRAKTPLPVLPKDSANAELTVATQKIETLERQTRELLTSLRSAPATPPVAKATDAKDPADLPTASEMMQRTLEAMRLEAQIAKDMDAYQKRPKRRFVGARAEEYRVARYVEDWRLKVERIGNLNYPEAARELKLYGSLLLTVSIRADGTVENVEVSRSSGQRVLDAAAVKIVQMAAPFAPFPPDIRRDTDVLHITRTWTFTKGDELRAD
jgi:protein TonB